MLKYISFQEYDNKSNTYRSTLNDDDNDDDNGNDDEPVLKIRKTSTMAQAVQRKVHLL